MYFTQLFGTWSLQMKKMVFVPFTLPSTPSARHPNLLAAEVDHISLRFGSQISCL
jgi:hypothetical protein